ncbi:TetR family transcriptional regulator (plasmid) [Deinococcus psychrotolerans]|uniref:TetR family transcriptional regulator n=1 Tax=Deinococcus psychrotolerans TaxID=2489213 RepID=A0A3G8YUX7_9DEIO|nr:TetR/AcrR family transcriptional regulator [Deinococcus psychrotolerans]AZI45016.1 TetR family transcriptional regulator [Deinococcus psychrotolerans]
MTLRERKRLRTRQAILAAATRLFERDGYTTTTLDDIAAAAEMSKRAIFSYFASKEDLLFPESDARIGSAIDAIAARQPSDGPVQVLMRAMTTTAQESDDLTGRRAALRLRLMRTVPALRGRALQHQLDAQREIARHLVAAFPTDLDPISAAALTGAFIGAVTAVLDLLFEGEDPVQDPAEVQATILEAVQVALAPWLRASPENA